MPKLYSTMYKLEAALVLSSDPPSVMSGEAVVRAEAGGERSAFITCAIDSNPPSQVS